MCRFIRQAKGRKSGGFWSILSARQDWLSLTKDITNPTFFELADMQSRQSIHEAFWSIKHAGNLFVRNGYEARLRYEAGIQAVVTMNLWPRELVPPLITGFTMDASRLIKAIKVGQ